MLEGVMVTFSVTGLKKEDVKGFDTKIGGLTSLMGNAFKNKKIKLTVPKDHPPIISGMAFCDRRYKISNWRAYKHDLCFPEASAVQCEDPDEYPSIIDPDDPPEFKATQEECMGIDFIRANEMALQAKEATGKE